MHLKGGNDLRLTAAKGFRNNFPVAQHRCALIAGPQTAIERGEDAPRMAALPAEKAVGDAGVFEFAGFYHGVPKG
jgi:hypothetical protein